MNMDWDSPASSQKHLWTQGSSAIALLDTERPVHAAWPPVPNNTGRKSHYVSKPGASNGHMNGGAHAITSHWKLTSCDSRALVQNTHCNERHCRRSKFPRTLGWHYSLSHQIFSRTFIETCQVFTTALFILGIGGLLLLHGRRYTTLMLFPSFFFFLLILFVYVHVV